MNASNEPEQILRLSEVKKRTGLSRSLIYTLIKQGKFPQAIRLHIRSVGFLSSEVESWIQAKAEARGGNNV